MYIFKTKPFKHQEEVLENSWKRPYYGLFMEMGLGKSKVIIDTIGKLKLDGEIDAVMIVAPKGVYDNWVKQEIPNHLPDEFDRFVVRWQPSSSKAFQDDTRKMIDKENDRNDKIRERIQLSLIQCIVRPAELFYVSK